MPQIFGWEHFVYLAVFIIISAVSLVAIKLKVKNERTLGYIIKGVGGLLLALVVWNRFTIVLKYDEPDWLSLIPNSFCGLCSFTFGISALAFKKDNPVFHCLVYLALWGCTLTMVYPDFIGQAESVFYPPTISGLLHHSVSLYLAVLMILTGWFRPSIRKFYCFPIGLAFFMTYGIFLIDCIGIESAMYIGEPLISDTIFTWYFVGFLIMLITAAVLVAVELIKRKREKKSA